MSNPPPPSASTGTPAGWFPDPLGRHEHRYFNGVAWTSDVSDAGQRRIDPYGTGPSAPAPGVQPGNGLATAALTCGIIGSVVAWIPFLVVIGIVLGVLALVFGVKGVRRAELLGRGRGPAVAGIVMGALTMLLAVVGVILTVVVFRAVSDFVETGPVDTEVVSCTFEGRDADVAGTLTNRSGVDRDYTLFVTVAGEVDVVTFEQVPPGTTVDWSARVRTRTVLSECSPSLVVQGPFPFGIEIDPIQR